MKLWALVRNTFREAVRDKVLLTLIVIAFLVTAAARLVPSLAAGEGTKIIQDLGLKSMTLFCVLIAVLVGGRLVYREIEKRTIFVILAKPVARWQFVLGKYLGLMLVLVTSVAIMTAWFALFMVISRVPMTPQMLLAVLLLVMELAVVTSIAVLFSTFVTPISSAVFTFAVYFTGNMSSSLLYWGTKDKPAALQLIAPVLLLSAAQPSELRYHERGRAPPAARLHPGRAERDLCAGLRGRSAAGRNARLPAAELLARMSNRRAGGRAGWWLSWLAVVIFGLGVFLLQKAMDQNRQRREELKAADELMYFPSGRLLAAVAGEYRLLVADYAWLQIAQYAGAHMGLVDQEDNYRWLGNGMEIVGELDPHFIIPYVFGSQLLGWDAERPAEGIALLRKGFERNPLSWELPFQAGFIAYMQMKDYDQAGYYFSLAAQLPGVWQIAPRMAAASYARTGNFELTREMWTRTYENQPNPKVREIARTQLLYLIGEELGALQAAADSFAERAGHLPASLEEVVARNYLEQIPAEPFGGRYVLRSGKVRDSYVEYSGGPRPTAATCGPLSHRATQPAGQRGRPGAGRGT